MATDPGDLVLLKKNIETARENAAKAEGAFQQTMEVLKKEFKVSTIGEAEKLLKKMEEQEVVLQADVDRMLKKFKEKYGDLSGNV